MVKAKDMLDMPLSDSVDIEESEEECISRIKKARKKRKHKKHIGEIVFIVAMLAYPIIHFLITWLYMNIETFGLSFQRYNIFANDFQIYQGDIFFNYKMWIDRFLHDAKYTSLLTNSLMYMVVSCFITLPLSIVCAYFFFKKIRGNTIFRIIFFLPSILPTVAMTFAFRYGFDSYGYVNAILRGLGVENVPTWFGTEGLTPFMIFFYCVWAGIGYNVVMLSGAMSRIPEDIVDYNRLEGVGFFRELTTIVVPMIWPTIVTLFTVGMGTVLTIWQQAYFLMDSSTAGLYGTGTIGMYIFGNYSDKTQIPQVASFGLLCSVMYLPILFFARWVMNKFFNEVDY
ncbi:MAG: carbohydrate ABC transporter permease [Candidatus Coproplasma sp.]